MSRRTTLPGGWGAALAKQRWLRAAVGFAISGLLMWLSLRSIDIRQLFQLLGSVNVGWVIVGLVIYWVELTLRIQRWAIIIKPVRTLRYRQIAMVLIVGYAANNVLPARLGELFRADYLGRRYKVSRFSAVGTIVIERTLDLAFVAACAVFGSVIFIHRKSIISPSLLTGIVIVSCLVALGIAGLYVVTLRSPRSILLRFPRLAFPINALTDGLRSINHPRLLFSLTGLSALIWFCNGLGVWATLHALGVSLDYVAIVLLIGVTGISAAIPAAPANLGTLQFAFITVLAIAGDPEAAGFAAALLIQVLWFGSVTLAGALLYAIGSVGAPDRSDHASARG